MLRDKTIKAIMEHAAAEYPRECCGVIAQKSRVERYFPCKNLSEDPTEQFILDPQGMMQAEDWGSVTYIVHSHPDCTTRPSELDSSQCDHMGIPWVIVSHPEGDLRIVQPRGDLPLIGRPFVLGFTDCWRLVMDYFKQAHGIELHDYRVQRKWWEEGDNLYMDNWYEAGFREFSGSIQDGDMVMMQIGKSDVVNHAGIVVEGGTMLLHHLYGHLSKRDPYRGGYYHERTIKIVRHKELF